MYYVNSVIPQQWYTAASENRISAEITVISYPATSKPAFLLKPENSSVQTMQIVL